jgi:hypothetical protein
VANTASELDDAEAQNWDMERTLSPYLHWLLPLDPIGEACRPARKLPCSRFFVLMFLPQPRGAKNCLRFWPPPPSPGWPPPASQIAGEFPPGSAPGPAPGGGCLPRFITTRPPPTARRTYFPEHNQVWHARVGRGPKQRSC